VEKPFPVDSPVHELLVRRWSPRAFAENRPVSPEALRTLLEAARIAPSCFNGQPWRFLVFDGGDEAALAAARDCLTPGNAWARLAPVLLLSVARESWERDGTPNRWAEHDVGLATENLFLQATALGLAVHGMGGFDAERARARFGIPEGYTPMAMIALGHPSDPATLAPKLQARELGPRQRKSLAEIAFSGRWDRAFEAPARPRD
jgi:nitroreductase